MIWKLVASGNFSSNDDGSEALTAAEVQDFGLEVDETLFALEVPEGAAGESMVQVRVTEAHGASLDAGAYVSNAAEAILSASLDTSPSTVLGSRTFSVPYFRPSIGVSSDGGARRTVYLNLWAGGRLI